MTRQLRIVITGANRGIGLHLTRQALELGHRVDVGARNPEKSAELLKLQNATPGQLIVHQLDVGSDESVRDFSHSLGAEPIDALINNAGVSLDKNTGTESVAPEVVLQTIDINAIGPLRVTQALIHQLKRAELPRVANISSLMGSIADNTRGNSVAYRMSKAALNMFVKTLSIDDRDLIVLALHPGWVKTEMGGPQAPMTPEASAEGLLNVILNAKHTDSGRFLNYAGRELPW